MKNSLIDLNNCLFEELERLNDDETLSHNDNLDKELKRSKAITGIGKVIVDNANVILNAKKYADEMGWETKDMPKLLTGNEK